MANAAILIILSILPLYVRTRFRSFPTCPGTCGLSVLQWMTTLVRAVLILMSACYFIWNKIFSNFIWWIFRYTGATPGSNFQIAKRKHGAIIFFLFRQRVHGKLLVDFNVSSVVLKITTCREFFEFDVGCTSWIWPWKASPKPALEF